MGCALPLVLLGPSGCILAPPRDYDEEPRLPPFIEVEHTSPTPYQFHEYSGGDTVDFKVRVRLSDPTTNGEDSHLYVVLFRNFENFRRGKDESSVKSGVRTVPSSFDEPFDITVRYTFSDEEDGCYQYTLFVTYANNGSPPEDVAHPEDVAMVTWWVNIETDQIPNDVGECLTEGIQ